MSAGSEPTTLNPLAVEAMAELGIDISTHRAKRVDDIDPKRVGTVITLCADEVCPAFLGDSERLHWPFDDPAAATGSHAEKLVAFGAIRDQIRARIEGYFQKDLGR